MIITLSWLKDHLSSSANLTKHTQTLRFLEIKESTNSIHRCMILDSTFLFVIRYGYMLLSKMLQNRITNSSKPRMHFDYVFDVHLV